jgi:isopenicillin N synthase-like dioxygenase
MFNAIPLIDLSDFNINKSVIAKQINQACLQHGFFYVAGHGVSPSLQNKLAFFSNHFFALPEKEKMKIAMYKAGKAWRGYFPLNSELTSGKPDLKEGIYFGTELGQDDPRVQRGLPLHGANLFPVNPPGFKEAVLEYIDAVTGVGHLVMKAISLSLQLNEDYFFKKYNQDPLILFRIFHYPPQKNYAQWGVGEHTDYGLLTILKQDDTGGLQVKTATGWIEAPPIENTFVCNIGDMLERLTGGLYRSTPHRVMNTSGKDRYSFPLFFDPGFDTRIERIESVTHIHETKNQRWDKSSVHEFTGTYGEYLINKIGKVFPSLKNDVL